MVGDEAIAPHKGKGPMRMYIPRKPNATRLKLYVLADSTVPYVVDMYIYKGKCRLRVPANASVVAVSRLAKLQIIIRPISTHQTIP